MRICVLVILLPAICLMAQETLPETRLAALPKSAALSQDTPEKVKLGRLLFFDPILSATRDVACATCHHPRFGWADGRATPLGVYATGLGPERKPLEKMDASMLTRNTPSILNVAFNGLRLDQAHDPLKVPMFWDNRVESLEAQVLAPIRSREEMRGEVCSEAEAVPQMIERLRGVPEYARLFGGEITAAKVAEAIAAFERTLITPETPFDRFMRGDRTALSASQQRGMEAFQRAGCALCHGGPMLSDFKPHAIGLSWPPLRTPTLRNLRHTAPYLHDGSQRTLEDVLLFYDRLMDHAAETLDGGDKASLPPLDPLLSRLDLRPEDHAPILDFLGALSTDGYDRSVPNGFP